MPEYKVVTLPLAESDIADQIAYELKAPETAISMVKVFKIIINNLSVFPQSHELDEDEELAKYGIRKTYQIFKELKYKHKAFRLRILGGFNR